MLAELKFLQASRKGKGRAQSDNEPTPNTASEEAGVPDAIAAAFETLQQQQQDGGADPLTAQIVSALQTVLPELQQGAEGGVINTPDTGSVDLASVLASAVGGLESEAEAAAAASAASAVN